MELSTSIAEPDSGGVSYAAIPPPLSAVWLACHCFKRLAKKDIIDVNIQEAVENIVAYSTGCRISLRIAGGLLVGVTRLYGRKIEMFQADCFEILRRMTLTRDTERASKIRSRQGDIARGARKCRRGNEHDDLNLTPINESDSLMKSFETERDYLEEFEEQQRNDTLLFEEVTKHLRLAASTNPNEVDASSLISGSEPSTNTAPSRQHRRKKLRIHHQEYPNDMLRGDDYDSSLFANSPSQEDEDAVVDRQQEVDSREFRRQTSEDHETRGNASPSPSCPTTSGDALAVDSVAKQFPRIEEYTNSSQSQTAEFDSQLYNSNSVPDAAKYAELGIFVLPYNSQDGTDASASEVGTLISTEEQLERFGNPLLVSQTEAQNILTPRNSDGALQQVLTASTDRIGEPDSGSAVPGPIEKLRGENFPVRNEEMVEGFEDNSFLRGILTSRRRRLSDGTLPPPDELHDSALVPNHDGESDSTISRIDGGHTHASTERRQSLAESILNMTMYSTGSPGSGFSVTDSDRFQFSPTDALSTSGILSESRPQSPSGGEGVHNLFPMYGDAGSSVCEPNASGGEHDAGKLKALERNSTLEPATSLNASHAVDGRASDVQEGAGISCDPNETCLVAELPATYTVDGNPLTSGLTAAAAAASLEEQSAPVTVVSRMRRRQQQQQNDRHHIRPVSVAAWLKHCGVALDATTILDDRILQQWQSFRKRVTTYRRSHATGVPSFVYRVRVNVGSIALQDDNNINNNNTEDNISGLPRDRAMNRDMHSDLIVSDGAESWLEPVAFQCGVLGCVERLLGACERCASRQSRNRRNALQQCAGRNAEETRRAAASHRSNGSPPKGSPAPRRRLSSGAASAKEVAGHVERRRSSDRATENQGPTATAEATRESVSAQSTTAPLDVDVEDSDELFVQLYDDIVAPQGLSSSGAPEREPASPLVVAAVPTEQALEICTARSQEASTLEDNDTAETDVERVRLPRDDGLSEGPSSSGASPGSCGSDDDPNDLQCAQDMTSLNDAGVESLETHSSLNSIERNDSTSRPEVNIGSAERLDRQWHRPARWSSTIARSMTLAGLRLQSSPAECAAEPEIAADVTPSRDPYPSVILETGRTPASFSLSQEADLRAVIRGDFFSSAQDNTERAAHESDPQLSTLQQHSDRTPFKTPLAKFSCLTEAALSLEKTPLESNDCTPTIIPQRNVVDPTAPLHHLEQRVETPAVHHHSWRAPGNDLAATLGERFLNTRGNRYEGSSSWRGGVVELTVPSTGTWSAGGTHGFTRGYIPASFSAASQASLSSMQQEVGFSRRTLRALEYLSCKLTQSMVFVTGPSSLLPNQPSRGVEEKENTGSIERGNAQTLPDTVEQEVVYTPAVSLKQLITPRQSRDVVAAVFFELLALRSRMIVNLQPVSPNSTTKAFVLSVEPDSLRHGMEEQAVSAVPAATPEHPGVQPTYLSVLSQPVSLRPDSDDILISTAQRYQQLIEATPFLESANV